MIAIGMMALLQLVGLLIRGRSLGRRARKKGRMLEHLEGIDAAIYLRRRQIKEVLDEIRRFPLTESAGSATT